MVGDRAAQLREGDAGALLDGHPIDRYADDLREYGAKTTADLVPKREAAVVTIAADEARSAWRDCRWRARRWSRTGHRNRTGQRQRPRRRGRLDRRDRFGPAAAEDPQGRPHVRLHARRCRGQHRGSGLSRSVQAERPPGGERPHRPRARDGSSATTKRRGSWRRRSSRSRWCGNGWPSRWPSGCRCPRMAGRRSSGCWDCSRSTRATGAWRS